MLRALLAATLLLIVGLAAAPTASAEEIRIGPCEVDACVYACVYLTEGCRGENLACFLFAFRVHCVPPPL